MKFCEKELMTEDTKRKNENKVNVIYRKAKNLNNEVLQVIIHAELCNIAKS